MILFFSGSSKSWPSRSNRCDSYSVTLCRILSTEANFTQWGARKSFAVNLFIFSLCLIYLFNCLFISERNFTIDKFSDPWPWINNCSEHQNGWTPEWVSLPVACVMLPFKQSSQKAWNNSAQHHRTHSSKQGKKHGRTHASRYDTWESGDYAHMITSEYSTQHVLWSYTFFAVP